MLVVVVCALQLPCRVVTLRPWGCVKEHKHFTVFTVFTSTHCSTVVSIALHCIMSQQSASHACILLPAVMITVCCLHAAACDLSCERRRYLSLLCILCIYLMYIYVYIVVVLVVLSLSLALPTE